ncbi:MAG: NDP-sugar synthase [Anaerolineae bacterium]|nr:NDP-sugar synthase [Anaerolineae bacterium]
MKALILAAGEGTRLRPLTLDRPKPMLPIAGKPLLEHTIAWLRQHGITQVAINLHHRPEAITDHFGDGRRWGVHIIYSYEEQLLGTAGAARRLQPFFDDTFVVVYGDVLTDMNLTAMLDFHRRLKRRLPLLATIALYRVPNPSECGLVGLDGSRRITCFVEKPPPQAVFTDLANAGVYVLEAAVLEHIPPDRYHDFGHDLFPALLERGAPLYGYPLGPDEFLIDIGSPEKYHQAQREWTNRLRTT